MRRAFRRYPAYKECLENAKSVYYVISKHGKDLRRVQFKCASCQKQFSRKDIAVDHLASVVDPMVGFIDYDTYAKRLFCNLDNLQVLCNKGTSSCHKLKSKEENKLRRACKK